MKFKLLQEFIRQGPVTVQVTGACMRGAIPQGNDVRLERNALYWPGDIVTFRRRNDEMVSHRFLGYLKGRSGWLALTLADNAKLSDSPVSLGDVLGRVTHVNGAPYIPGLYDRIWAQAKWFPAVARSITGGLRTLFVILQDR